MKKYHFDLIIANPPYGKVGADIIMQAAENIDWNECVVLDPIKDICRRKDLVKHIIQTEALPIGAFEDAVVTTALSKVSKTEVNNMSADEFLIKSQTNRNNLLYRYTVDNYLRQSYTPTQIYGVSLSDLQNSYLGSNPVDVGFLISQRESSHLHLPYSKTSVQYRWNVLHNITPEEAVSNWRADKTGRTHGIMLLLSSKVERDNLSDFIYSKDGFRFLSMQFDAMQSDCAQYIHTFPKVDWTHSWTVQEILKEYNYTEEEIAQVMEELKKYKLGEMHQD